MKTTDQTARAGARISAGDEFPEPHMEQYTVWFTEPPANGCLIDFNKQERVVPLPWYLTADEWLQRRMPWNGLTIAAAIVLAIAVGVLLAHAWGRLG